jgi:hypothetical protein
MDTLINAVVGLHILGIAVLLGGCVTRLKVMGGGTGAARFVPGMLYGAATMLVTGVTLVGLLHADGEHTNNVKLGVKPAVLVVVLGLVHVKRDEERIDPVTFAAVGALTAANVFIAVLWT